MVVEGVDFTHIRNALTKQDALEILTRGRRGKRSASQTSKRRVTARTPPHRDGWGIRTKKCSASAKKQSALALALSS
jgi:hypothetical protein